MLADMSMVWLFPEKFYQHLTNTDGRYSQSAIGLSPGAPTEELGEGLKELKGIAIP